MEDAEVAGFLFSSFLMWNINTKMKSDPGIGMTNLPLRASTTNVCICGGAVKGRPQSLHIAAFTPVPDGHPQDNCILRYLIVYENCRIWL